MNKIVYFVRHGLIRSNEKDVYAGRSAEQLSKTGKERAEQLGREMRDWGIELIQTSPLKRTVQTARILNKYCQAEMMADADLIEIELGPWTGLSKDEVRRRYPHYYRHWIEHPETFDQPGVEPLENVRSRVVRSVERFITADRHSVAAFITHSVAVRVAVLYFDGKPLHLYHQIEVPNLSVYRLTFALPEASCEVARLK